MCLTESAAPFRTEQTQREREREREGGVRAHWERERPRAAVIFRCIIFIFATSRIHKKHVQLGHADGCRGNKHSKQQPFACPRPRLMRISYMKSFSGGPWLLGALGFWGPKAVAYLCLMGKSAPAHRYLIKANKLFMNHQIVIYISETNCFLPETSCVPSIITENCN